MPKFLLKLLVSAALLAWILTDVETGAVFRAIETADVVLLAAACLCQFLLSVPQTLRWMRVSRVLNLDMPFRSAWANVLIGLFFNQTLPSSIGGDAVRVWRLGKTGIGLGAAFRSVALDRLTALMALILLCLVGTPLIADSAGDAHLALIVPGISVVGALGIFVVAIADRVDWPGILGRAADRLGLPSISRDTRRVLGRGGALIPALLYSLGIHVGVAVSGYSIATALGVSLPFWPFVLLFSTVLLISMVPITVAGWGLREGAMVTALGLLGVAAADAVAISVIFGLVMVAVGAPGGVLWVATRRMEASELA